MDFEYYGEGRGRRVYRHGKWVIKIPLNESGVGDNYHEAWVFRMRGRGPDVNGVCHARCRLIPGSAILVMELVRDPSLDEDPKLDDVVPAWSGYVDCAQVGLARDNAWVAYDYGLG